MSSLTLYDQALKNKIKSVFNNIIISEPDLAFKRAGERKGEEGKVKFPLLSLFREDETINSENFNYRRLRSGVRNQKFGSEEQVVQAIKQIPVRLDYQLDIFTEKKIVADKIMEEMLFWLYTDLSIVVTPPETKLVLINDKLFINNYRIEDDIYSVEVIDTSGEEGLDLEVELSNKKLEIRLATDMASNLDDNKNSLDNIIEKVNNIEGFRAFKKSGVGEDYLESGFEETEISGIEKQFSYTIEDIQDNSELMGFEERGRYYRKTILFYLSNVRLFASELSNRLIDIDYSYIDIEEG